MMIKKSHYTRQNNSRKCKMFRASQNLVYHVVSTSLSTEDPQKTNSRE